MESCCLYDGETVASRFDGQGTYQTSEGKYIGSFLNGQFHGAGTLYVHGGRFEGEFEAGKFVKGSFFFEDGLEYKDANWEYCTEKDPRFYTEIMEDIPPTGPLKYASSMAKPPRLPMGCYDTIDGYFDPKAACVREYYSHNEIRKPDKDEIKWIVANCRIGK